MKKFHRKKRSLPKELLRRLKVRFKFPSNYDLSTVKRITVRKFRGGKFEFDWYLRIEKPPTRYLKIPTSITFEHDFPPLTEINEEIQEKLRRELLGWKNE